MSGTGAALCVLCKTGQQKAGEATVTLNRDETSVTVRHVPADVCDTCGEEYLDGAIAKRLETILAGAIADGVKYSVRDYVTTSVR